MSNEKKNGYYTETCPDGSKIEECFLNGKHNREDGPALTTWHPNGRITRFWFRHDVPWTPPKSEAGR